MIISKRERMLVLGTGGMVGIAVLIMFVVVPVLDAAVAAASKTLEIRGELDRNQKLLDRQTSLQPVWQQITAGGLKTDPNEAESQILHSIREWSQEAKLKLVSIQPEREAEKKVLQEASFRAVGTGTMESVRQFLVLIESSKIPIRIKELQVGSRKDGVDDLTIQMRLSTLYHSAKAAAAPVPAASPAKTSGETK
jgi:hypothetical protein